MVRTGNQHKNGLDRKTTNRTHTISEPADVSLSAEKEKPKGNGRNNIYRERSNGDNLCRLSRESVKDTKYTGSGKRNKQRSCNVPCREQSDDGTPRSAQAADMLGNLRDAAGEDLSDASESRGNDVKLFGSDHNTSHSMSEVLSVENMTGNIGSSDALPGRRLRVLALYVLNAANGWLERQKPRLSTFTAYMSRVHDYILVQIKHAYPIIWTLILHFGKSIFLLSVIWLDCNLRGLNSLLRLGTTSFFTVLWCSILSIIAMVGITKVLIIMAIAFMVAAFIGLALAILIIAVFATVILWLYGSFWVTGQVIFIGGITFALSHERAALLVTTIYSMHCAKSYLGWLGLILGLNLSFISSDVLIHFLRNINEHRSDYPPEQDGQTPNGASHFFGEPDDFQSDSRRSADHSAGVPSTSGSEAELTSEYEVVRLLNCNDHYSAMGFTCFENIDVSLLKREYRKKAMLVHPDKNMGNEKAAEAFKKLQNAYEILLDTLKRKTYDDELRREELLNYFRRFQTASRKNGKHDIFSSGTTQFEAEDKGLHGESRRIACKKCSDFHIWTRTERSKSRARWCQDCKDFHQAKDGDGWLEQTFHPFLFGLLHKVDAPCAYVCAESRIYDATEWLICQGMRCPVNTHKPSFHVNTSLSSKHSSCAKGTGSSHKAGGGIPTANLDETMEEEFFEWLQNAVQSGVFEASDRSGSSSSMPNEGPSGRSGSGSKSGSIKKRRKGKKQW